MVLDHQQQEKHRCDRCDDHLGTREVLVLTESINQTPSGEKEMDPKVMVDLCDECRDELKNILGWYLESRPPYREKRAEIIDYIEDSDGNIHPVFGPER